ncbi:MAG: pyridoxamine 5'-phosphate oxidase family protein [Gemmatimonadetes bacterium]|nr:pyridoxamine 5'-phosphate oxidase family protein [Gemmatimonadota bacterium]
MSERGPERDPSGGAAEAGEEDRGRSWTLGAAEAPAASLAEPRRRDRAMEDAWIRAFLERAPWGVLATVEGGRPFLNANLFAYEEARHAVWTHTARVGRTRTNMDAAEGKEGAPVAFSVSVMGRLLPAAEALEFSVEYAGVVILGRGVVVDDPEEKEHGLQLILDRYAPHLRPGRDYRPITAGELKRTSVYRIDVEAWSGKQKAVAPDFPGAFELPAVAVPFEPQG